jgi:hypothetical protein
LPSIDAIAPLVDAVFELFEIFAGGLAGDRGVLVVVFVGVFGVSAVLPPEGCARTCAPKPNISNVANANSRVEEPDLAVSFIGRELYHYYLADRQSAGRAGPNVLCVSAKCAGGFFAEVRKRKYFSAFDGENSCVICVKNAVTIELPEI